ncbi:hypothetical protein [Endozoicomonas sp.]|uniref:hypothetical protein n=1 Tax=Endozoicomonas sp. TaxID=1892382 RepID=UPI00383B5258
MCNSELIHCLEQALLPKRVSPEAYLQRARVLRQVIATDGVNMGGIQDTIDEGWS